MNRSFKKLKRISGSLSLPGDKSISHRALIISSLAKGKSKILNLSNSDDLKSTMNCLEKLGIQIEQRGEKTTVIGNGYQGYQKPIGHLIAGNSGTSARLLSGILAAQKFESVVIGDNSLSSRPMRRVTEPLLRMGAKISLSEKETLPAVISESGGLNPIEYQLSVPSAQVKSAILLAGLHINDETKVIETSRTRNHTENLLGLKVNSEHNKIVSYSSREYYPTAKEYFVPGDISTAVFFIVLTLLSKNSELVLKNISLNPTRTEIINTLVLMGAKIEIELIGASNNEQFGNLIIKSSDLANIKIDADKIPLIIDEIPILTIAGIFAEGDFEIRGAKELRVKESDRISAICSNLKKIGLNVEEFEDGFAVSGMSANLKVTVDSFGDHRIAMSFAVLASLMDEGGEISNFDCVNSSNPEFLQQLQSISN